MASVIIIVLLIVGCVAYCELMDPNSKINNWIWCKKHGLRLKEYPSAIGGGVIFWCGVDENGDEYVPDKNGNPRKLERKD